MGLVRKVIEKQEQNAIHWPVDIKTVDDKHNKIMRMINAINQDLNSLKNYRRKDERKLRELICDDIIEKLNAIKLTLSEFAKEYKEIEKINISYNSYTPAKFGDICLATDVEMKMGDLKEKKKQMRAEFEKIYINFRKIAKGLENIPMNYMLTLMRESFNFDNSKFKDNSNQNKPKQYDNFVCLEDLLPTKQ